jgi:cellobiose-specific phosphotransferase system component IIA
MLTFTFSVKLRCDNLDPVPISSVLAALEQCQKYVVGMIKFSRDLQKGFTKRRILTALKTTTNKQKMAEFQRHLEQAKTTLLLAVNVATFLLQ